MKEFRKGILKENPVLILLLGLCPTLATSTRVLDAVGMMLAATFVLVCSNAIISLFGGLFPAKIRIPCYIVVIASFVTCADMVMAAYAPDIHTNLGIFIPLIVVNCIILGRAEAFASKHGLWPSIQDGLGMGLGFGLVLVSLAVVRELFGSGSLCGITITTAFSAEGPVQPIMMLTQAPGAFLLIALYIGLVNHLRARSKG